MNQATKKRVKLVTQALTNKYGARKIFRDGIQFDSKFEADYYNQLKLLERAGEVTKIDLQPRYLIIDGYIHPTTGKKIRPTHYIGDFLVTYKDGRQELIDCKGVKTALYLLKKKIFESKYGIPIKEVQR